MQKGPRKVNGLKGVGMAFEKKKQISSYWAVQG